MTRTDEIRARVEEARQYHEDHPARLCRFALEALDDVDYLLPRVERLESLLRECLALKREPHEWGKANDIANRFAALSEGGEP